MFHGLSHSQRDLKTFPQTFLSCSLVDVHRLWFRYQIPVTWCYDGTLMHIRTFIHNGVYFKRVAFVAKNREKERCKVEEIVGKLYKMHF